MLDVYYAIDEDKSIWVTEKSFFDKENYIQDDNCDNNYIKIENAMEKCGYPRLMESNYEYLDEEEFNHDTFIKNLAVYGINMIYNKALED